MCQTIKSLQSAIALLEQELQGLYTARPAQNHISDMYAEIHGMVRALNHKKAHADCARQRIQPIPSESPNHSSS